MASLYRLKLDKSSLVKLSPTKLEIFLGGGKILNDLNVSTKHLIFAMNSVKASDKDADRSAAFAALGFFLRNLAGHVCEARRFFRSSVRINELGFRGSYFEGDFAADVKSINKYFGKNNIIDAIRNKFSVHTDGGILRKSYSDLPDGFTYDMFIGNDAQGHNIYYGSEMTIINGVHHLGCQTDWETAIQAAFNDTSQLSTLLGRIFQQLMLAILKELGITMDDTELLDGTDGPPINTVIVPFFCTSAESPVPSESAAVNG